MKLMAKQYKRKQFPIESNLDLIKISPLTENQKLFFEKYITDFNKLSTMAQWLRRVMVLGVFLNLFLLE